MKKLFALALAGALSLSVFAGCGNEAPSEEAPAEAPSEEVSAETPSENAPAEEKKEGGITIAYPENMQKRGFTEPVVLEEFPENIVCMSSNPVMALYELGVKMTAVPNSGVVAWPADLEESTVKVDSVMSDNFNIENIIAMDPDLLLAGFTSKEKYGQALDDAGIPVYYLDAGPSVPYASIKAQTQALVDAFAPDSEKGEALMNKFTETEAKLDTLRPKYEDKSVMVLRCSIPNYDIQTAKGTLGSLADMLGFKNVFEGESKSGNVPLDLEQAISYDPDIVLCVSGYDDPNELKTAMEAEFEKNPDYWYSIEAIKDGDIVYFPRKFMPATGIQVLDNLAEFIDAMEAHFGE